jgi:hypothetical protein
LGAYSTYHSELQPNRNAIKKSGMPIVTPQMMAIVFAHDAARSGWKDVNGRDDANGRDDV